MEAHEGLKGTVTRDAGERLELMRGCAIRGSGGSSWRGHGKGTEGEKGPVGAGEAAGAHEGLFGRGCVREEWRELTRGHGKGTEGAGKWRELAGATKRGLRVRGDVARAHRGHEKGTEGAGEVAGAHGGHEKGTEGAGRSGASSWGCWRGVHSGCGRSGESSWGRCMEARPR